MWVKRTEVEIAEERRRLQRSRLQSCIFVGVIFTTFPTFLFGWRESADRGRLAVPADEILTRLPLAMVFGVIAAFVAYKLEKRRPPIMICPQCEATKYMDNTNECSCGGRFERIDVMKHVS